MRRFFTTPFSPISPNSPTHAVLSVSVEKPLMVIVWPLPSSVPSNAVSPSLSIRPIGTQSSSVKSFFNMYEPLRVSLSVPIAASSSAVRISVCPTAEPMTAAKRAISINILFITVFILAFFLCVRFPFPLQLDWQRHTPTATAAQ